MIEVKGKERESFESILRRFSRKVQQSGVLTRARKIRFFQREKSRNLQRVIAQHRSKMREEREEMKRLGKFVPKRGPFRR
jgi:ribosomal protein S21